MEATKESNKLAIATGKTALGIELGSTRIKAVLVNDKNEPIASGSFEWENQYVDNVWTYDLTQVWEGVQTSYQRMAQDVLDTYGEIITTIGSIGFSGMMHGYLVFDKEDQLLVPFRSWRNTITEEASKVLTQSFQYHIPQRWSIAHLYQAILNQEPHVKNINYMTTLSGYVHWKLTGEKVMGIGEASGMFPVRIEQKDYNLHMLEQFNRMIANNHFTWTLDDILPRVLLAGEEAGKLTKEGANLLDPTGNLQAGIPFCPPEGDAGTGMVATNSVAKRTGNVSAGTSVFAMVVLEKELSKAYEEIDLVTTPMGDLVAMVHCNNCTSDLNAWVNLFKECLESYGITVDMTKLYATLYNKALQGDTDCGGLLAYNYFSGEHITRFDEGRPLFVRTPESNFDLANFMRTHLFTALGALKTGLNILMKKENVQLDEIVGHGGLFKTKGVGQRMMAAATEVPVSVMETAGEGGAWGIALLASYMIHKEEGESLDQFLSKRVFSGQMGSKVEPIASDVEGFQRFMQRYTSGLAIERAAVMNLKE